MKILVVINENFSEVILGKNTTLSYALAAVEQNHDVYIWQINEDGKLPLHDESIEVLQLNASNDAELIEKFKSENRALVGAAHELPSGPITVGNFYAKKLRKTTIKLSQIEFVIQRLEPMKAPFPPEGEISINNFLQEFTKLFPPHFVFNNPYNCYGDKELPLVIDNNNNLATPTLESFADDQNLVQKLLQMGKKYAEIFQNNKQKIVIKPNDSAQTLGIFSIEFVNYSLQSENEFQEKTIAELCATQSYQISLNQGDNDIINLVKLFCFAQFCKIKTVNYTRQVKNITDEEITQALNSLYGDKILIQPFLEGVREGDMRIFLAKLEDENFHVVGALFRKSIKHDEKNFTTCLTAGQSKAMLIQDCTTSEERNNLQKIVNYTLQRLNTDLKEKYRNSTEIGCDFLLSGNQKNVYFGEANHHCPANITVSEAIRTKAADNFYAQINGLKMPYNGGLAVSGEILRQQILLQTKN